MTHELHTEGPIAYPGGKNDWHRAWCSCDPTRFWWGPTEVQALKSGARDHKKAKDAAELEAARIATTPDEYRLWITSWLTGSWTHEQREDLARVVAAGSDQFVTLTYRELWEIINTVHINSKQR